MVHRLAAKQLIDGNAQRLAFDIVKRRIYHRFGMMIVAHEHVHAADLGELQRSTVFGVIALGRLGEALDAAELVPVDAQDLTGQPG